MILKTGNEIIQTGNEIIQTGNGIVSPTSRPLIKNFFYNILSILTKEFKLVFKTGNRIISPTFGPLIKKLLLKHLLHIYQGIQNWFSKQELELFKQEMELLLPLPGLWSKNLFYTILSMLTKESKLVFKTENGIIQTGNGIISSTSGPVIKKLLL